MDTSKLEYFFDCCIGNWQIERTYHYLSRNEVERSHTTFTVRPLTPELTEKVLQDNRYELAPGTNSRMTGFQLAFRTVSDKGEEVSQSLNALFVPRGEEDGVLEGDYLRDRAYEEAIPITSHFRFNSQTQELLMTTPYTRVVAVDSITLLNPNLRVRQIISYYRPPEGQPLEQVGLIGFGVEKKVG